MRVLLTAILLACPALAPAGCRSDPAARCAEAYDHMITLAKRPPAAEARDPFIEACVTAWDVQRHDCLMAATDADQALDCRGQRGNN
ncbi:MAG: hypothetical protein R3F39_00520 [Myxococcota bacterium]